MRFFIEVGGERLGERKKYKLKNDNRFLLIVTVQLYFIKQAIKMEDECSLLYREVFCYGNPHVTDGHLKILKTG